MGGALLITTNTMFPADPDVTQGSPQMPHNIWHPWDPIQRGKLFCIPGDTHFDDPLKCDKSDRI